MHQDSWQARLHRTSPFLASGQGVRWTQSDRGYTFFDGKADSCYNLKGPDLLHFRDSAVGAVYRRQQECWEYIIDGNIELPTTSVKLYTIDGEYTSTHNTSVECVPSTSDHTPVQCIPSTVIKPQLKVFPLPVNKQQLNVFPLSDQTPVSFYQ